MSDGEPCTCLLCGKPATRHILCGVSIVACECVSRFGDGALVSVRGLDGQEFKARLLLDHPIRQGKAKLP